MSVKAADRAWESGAAGTDLLVLLALADHAGGEDDPYGHAYPSVDRLVLMTKTSRRTVQRSLRSLEEQGLIRSTGQYAWGRGKVTTVYRIEGEGGVRMTPRQDDGGVTSDQEGASPVAPKPSIEPSKAVESARAPEVEQVFAEWNRATERSRTQLTAERRRIIQKAIASHGLDDCLAAVRNIGADRWARGENDRGRRFDDIEHALGNAKRIEHWRERTAPPAGVTHLRPNASAEERRMERQRQRAERIREYDRQAANNGAMIASVYPTAEDGNG